MTMVGTPTPPNRVWHARSDQPGAPSSAFYLQLPEKRVTSSPCDSTKIWSRRSFKNSAEWQHSSDAAATLVSTGNRPFSGKSRRWRLFWRERRKEGRCGGESVQLHSTAHPLGQGSRSVWGSAAATWQILYRTVGVEIALICHMSPLFIGWRHLQTHVSTGSLHARGRWQEKP